jgi:1-acyl-sn-glycerol-3-phosphate acyltransferase
MAELFELSTFSIVTGKINRTFGNTCHQIGKYIFGYGWKAKVVYENLENIPKEPCIWVSNHVHYYDWWPFRCYLEEWGYPATSIAKPRPYQYPAARWFLNTAGNIPIASRGYIIAADFKQIIGRKPSNEEFNALNNCIRKDAPLPDTPEFKKIQMGPRNILGVPYDPTVQNYSEALQNCYWKMGQESIRIIQDVVDIGLSIHIYPQGLFSTRLTKGRIGALQLAAQTGLPILPIGFNGYQKVYPNPKSPFCRKGTLTYRIGEVYQPDLSELPKDFTAFHPKYEREYKVPLERETQIAMNKINDLLEPENQWDSHPEGDGFKGNDRFL